MGIIHRFEDEQTELQKNIAADIRAKSVANSAQVERDIPDGVKDSSYIERTKESSGLLIVWVVLGLFVVGFLIWLATASSS